MCAARLFDREISVLDKKDVKRGREGGNLRASCAEPQNVYSFVFSADKIDRSCAVCRIQSVVINR